MYEINGLMKTLKAGVAALLQHMTFDFPRPFSQRDEEPV